MPCITHATRMRDRPGRFCETVCRSRTATPSLRAHPRARSLKPEAPPLARSLRLQSRHRAQVPVSYTHLRAHETSAHL
eukprot:4235748-Alexandrium_andersonii.AAC.1